jgi:outer membrane protein OmpA-like peptidoglycan-associated protein
MATGETTLYNSPGIIVRDLEYSKGKIWIASNQGILTILTRSNELGRITFDKKSGLPSNNVAFIHIDDQKQTWIGTDKGIVFINGKDKWKTYEKKLQMEAMHYNHEGLWLVSNEEMWVIDPYNRWYPAAIDKGLRKGAIRDITADSTGRLYMASDILVRYDPYEETIESYADNTAIVSKVCTAVESDRDNRIWLGTKGGGLFLFGYADQARTIEDLVVSRNKKLELAASNGVPEIEVAIVESDIEKKLEESASKIMDTSSEIVVNQDKTPNEEITQSKQTADLSAVTGINSAEGVSRPKRKARETDSDIDKADVKVTKSSRMMIESQIEAEIKCPGDLARVSINIQGGSKPFRILWDDGIINETSRNLAPGSYRVVAEDSLGQSISTNILIDGKQALELRTINKRSPSAEGRLDGNIKVAAFGGTGPYEFSWENGEKGDRARRLTGGLHQISVTDANGCLLVSEVNLKGARIMPDLEISRVTVGQKLEISNIYYEADSTDITEESFEVLDEIYEFLIDNEDVKIEIGGHTNSLPPDEYCDRVSTARAKSLAEYLYKKGIEESRISYVGYGKRNPIASNETKEGRRRNQRVEVKIISLVK